MLFFLKYKKTLLYYKNRFPGLPEAIGTVSRPFWEISANKCLLTVVDHFCGQIPSYVTKSDQMGPNPIIWDQNPIVWSPKSDHTWVIDMLEFSRDH